MPTRNEASLKTKAVPRTEELSKEPESPSVPELPNVTRTIQLNDHQLKFLRYYKSGALAHACVLGWVYLDDPELSLEAQLVLAALSGYPNLIMNKVASLTASEGSCGGSPDEYDACMNLLDRLNDEIELASMENISRIR